MIQTTMNMRFFQFSLLAAVITLLAGCVSPTRVDYDSAMLAKLRSYECFVIDSRETRSTYQDAMLSPIVDRRIERAIATELKVKAFKQNCDAPDFRVTFNITTEKKTEITNLGAGPSAFRRYPYMGYGGYNHYDVNEYKQGTFIIDIIDNTSKQLVWRGVYTKRLGWKAPTDSDIQKMMAEVLAEFPPIASK